MSKSLSELDLHDEEMPAMNADDLPTFGGWTPPPQPGPMRFKLPGDLSKVWDVYESNGKSHVRAVFDKDNPLLIVRSLGGAHNNEGYQTRLSSQRRQRGQFEASDFDYLLKALGEKALPSSGKAAATLLESHAGEEFDADNTYSWYCSPSRDIYAPAKDAAGQPVEGTEKQEGVKGCGARYYQAEKTKKEGAGIAKVNGEYPFEIQCRCGAIVRAFAGLDGIRK